jgi:hypothetical protein
MKIALIAALAMVATDVLGTVMVMAEAKERGWLAGIMDCLGWYVSILTTTISVTSLQGHDTTQKVWVLVLVGAANIFGTKLGVVTGRALMRRYPAESFDDHLRQREMVLDPVRTRASRH